MKLLGHAWVAVQAAPRRNRQLLILGSILPEITYYTTNHPFSAEEIHEGGEIVYCYLLKRKPNWADLGLGMISHSVKLGADKFNFDDNLAILGYKGKKLVEFRKKLSSILKISDSIAKIRTHNILELALEINIIRENSDFVIEFNQAIADKKTRAEIKKILTDCFGKNQDDVSMSVDELFDKISPTDFKGPAGLAQLWGKLAKDFDPTPNYKALTNLLLKISEDFSSKDKRFLKDCIDWTRGNIEREIKSNH